MQIKKLKKKYGKNVKSEEQKKIASADGLSACNRDFGS
jgi:hypothetical protein